MNSHPILLKVVAKLSYNYNYRVSCKTLATFVFWISRLPMCLKIPHWTFFHSPFHVDFRNIQFFIIRWSMEWNIVRILQGGHCLLFDETIQHSWLSWALMSSCKHSCVLMSTQEHSCVGCQGAMSAHECWWAIIAPCSWLLLCSHECSLVDSSKLMASHVCY